MYYFLTLTERQNDITNTYVEFQTEKHANNIFDEESIYLLKNDYISSGFCNFLCDCVYKYDLFDIDTINAEEWDKIFYESQNREEIIKEMAKEIQMWVQPLFAKGEKYFILETESVFLQKNSVKPQIKALLPNVNIPCGYTEETYFEFLCRKGLNTRYGSMLSPEIIERFDKELGIINKLKLESYFIMLYNFITFAKNNKINFNAGIGSASGSIVCFVLSITDVDPIKYNLCFECFINEERTVVPDVDFELSPERINSAIEYYNDNYHICYITEIEKYNAISAFSEVSENTELPEVLKQEIIDIFSCNNFGIDICLIMSKKLNELYENNTEVHKIINKAKELEYTVKSVLTDLTGIVILPKNSSEQLPIENCNGIERITYTRKELYERGFVILDFIPINQLYEDKKSLLVKDFNTSCFEELIFAASNYLLRQALSEESLNFVKPKICDCKILDDILLVSHGYIVYYEQILDILHKLSGFDYVHAETVRRYLANRNRPAIEAAQYKFVRSSINNGYDLNTALSIFDAICSAAPYAFSKAYAAGFIFPMAAC